MAGAAGECHSRLLDELRAEHGPDFGGKSAALGELLAAGVPVPDGFALSVGAYGAFVAAAGLEEMLAETLSGLSPDDPSGTMRASRAIGEQMRRAPIPGPVREQLESRYARLAGASELASPPVAVRSSAVGEDSEEATFAGQQASYLWVRGLERVCDAVRDCWASLYSPEAIAYRARLSTAERQPAMGVTVQLMVDALISGVAFTCNPVSGDPSMVAINASWGLGLAVVGGEVTPDDYLVSKITGELVRATASCKEIEYVPDADADADGPSRLEVPESRRDVRCLDERALQAVVDIARRIEHHFGSHQDIEWAIAREGELPDSLYVLQSRPVTGIRKPKQEQPSASALSLVMKTFGAG